MGKHDASGETADAIHAKSKTTGHTRTTAKSSGYHVGRDTSEPRVSGGSPPSGSGWSGSR